MSDPLKALEARVAVIEETVALLKRERDEREDALDSAYHAFGRDRDERD